MTTDNTLSTTDDTLSQKQAKSAGVEMESDGVNMKKTLGLPGGVSFIVGGIIGSGIFISPSGVLESTGSPGLGLIVWTGSGLIALMGALCYCELGTLIPKSGGEYSYLQKAFGNGPAFIYTWVSVILVRPASVAVKSLTFGVYFATLFPICGSPKLLPVIAAVCCIVSIMVVNSLSTELSTRLQVVTTVAKIAALLVIVFGGLVKLGQGHTGDLASGFSGSESDPSTIALAFYKALWAYSGWNTLNYVTEEVKNPSRNIPLANIISVLLVISVYLLTNVGYLAVMTTQEILDADAVAVTWGDRVLGGASIIVPLAVMISNLGSVNSTAFTGGRLVFAAARDGNLPEVLSLVTVKQRTPLTSMVFTMTLSIIYVMLGELGSLINFLSFSGWIFYLMTFISLLIFRYKLKDSPRPYRVPIIIPVVMIGVSVYLVVAPIVNDPRIEFLYATLCIAAGLVFYIPFVFFKLKFPFTDDVTVFMQLLSGSYPASKYED